MDKKLHHQAKKMNSFYETPESIACMNLATSLESIDSDLLHFLAMMTDTVKQSRRKLFESTNTVENNTSTQKTIRSMRVTVLH